MSTSWVASVVRARALAERRLGEGGARALAARGGLADAVSTLLDTPYRHDVRSGMTLAEAQHATGDSLLWNMRVLAGWLPRGGADVIRMLAAGFEVANIDEHLAQLHAGPADPPYELGTLETAWSRVSWTTTVADGDRGPRHLVLAPARPRRSTGTAGRCPARLGRRRDGERARGRGVGEVGRRPAGAPRGAPARTRPLAPARAPSRLRGGFRLRRRGSDGPDRPEDGSGAPARRHRGRCSRASTGWRTCGWPRRGGGVGSSTTGSGCCGGRRTTRGRWWARWPCWLPTPGGSGRRSRWPRAAVGRHWRRSMRWREVGAPLRMQRVALVAPVVALRDMLVQVADSGVVEVDPADGEEPGVGTSPPRLSRTPPDLDELARAGRDDLVRGAAGAGTRRRCGGVWRGCGARRLDTDDRDGRARRRAGPHRSGCRPHSGTAWRRPADAAGARRKRAAVVHAPGRDLRHGAVRRRRPEHPGRTRLHAHVRDDVRRRGARCPARHRRSPAADRQAPQVRPAARTVWPFVAGSGLVAMVFGLLYGEFFGPTGVIPGAVDRPRSRNRAP